MKYLIIILLFASCNATKQSAKHLNKAFKKDRVYVAKVTRDSFPCITGKVISSDSTSYKNLLKTIDSINNLDPIIEKKIEYIPIYEDSIHCVGLLGVVDRLKNIIVTKDNKIKQLNAAFSNFKPIHDTIPVRDSAEVVIAQNELAVVKEEKEEYKGKAERRGNLNLYLIIALLLSALLNFIQFKRK